MVFQSGVPFYLLMRVLLAPCSSTFGAGRLKNFTHPSECGGCGWCASPRGLLLTHLSMCLLITHISDVKHAKSLALKKNVWQFFLIEL